MARLQGRSPAPQTTSWRSSWPQSLSPDPIAADPNDQRDFQQIPTTGPNTNSGVENSVTVKGQNQGTIIALGIICGILILLNVLFVLLCCLGGRYLIKQEAFNAPVSPSRRYHRSKKHKSRPVYPDSSMSSNDESSRTKNLDRGSLLGPVDGVPETKGESRLGQANVPSVPPAYFPGDHRRDLGRAQKHHSEKFDDAVDDPSDASVAGSSKWDDGPQMHGGRSPGSQKSWKSFRTEAPPGRTRGH